MNTNMKRSLDKLYLAASNNTLGAREADKGCAYFTGVTTCAIGAMLPEGYKERIEGLRINTGSDYLELVDSFPELEDVLGLSSEQGLVLQELHDHTYFSEEGNATCAAGRLSSDNYRHLIYLLKEGIVTKISPMGSFGEGVSFAST